MRLINFVGSSESVPWAPTARSHLSLSWRTYPNATFVTVFTPTRSPSWARLDLIADPTADAHGVSAMYRDATRPCSELPASRRAAWRSARDGYSFQSRKPGRPERTS